MNVSFNVILSEKIFIEVPNFSLLSLLTNTIHSIFVRNKKILLTKNWLLITGVILSQNAMQTIRTKDGVFITTLFFLMIEWKSKKLSNWEIIVLKIKLCATNYFELYMYHNYCFRRKQHSYAACDAVLVASYI